jgi:hypothetical protein
VSKIEPSLVCGFTDQTHSAASFPVAAWNSCHSRLSADEHLGGQNTKKFLWLSNIVCKSWLAQVGADVPGVRHPPLSDMCAGSGEINRAAALSASAEPMLLLHCPALGTYSHGKKHIPELHCWKTMVFRWESGSEKSKTSSLDGSYLSVMPRNRASAGCVVGIRYLPCSTRPFLRVKVIPPL